MLPYRHDDKLYVRCVEEEMVRSYHYPHKYLVYPELYKAVQLGYQVFPPSEEYCIFLVVQL